MVNPVLGKWVQSDTGPFAQILVTWPTHVGDGPNKVNFGFMKMSIVSAPLQPLYGFV